MKRDLDLIRSILKNIESLPAGELLTTIKYPEYDQTTINEHVNLLIEAGLIDAKVVKTGVTKRISKFYITGLKWSGHDFLLAAKDDSIWNTAKEKFLKPGVSFSFDLLFEWLKIKAKEKLVLPCERKN